MTRPLTPAITVDIIIEMADLPERPIVLIERRFEPFGWALPGGFVDIGERLERAAIREAKEETSLDVKLLMLLGNYSEHGRDPRGHTVSAVYLAEATGEARAMDDAKNLALFELHELPELAFDHAQILQDYRLYRESGEIPVLNVG